MHVICMLASCYLQSDHQVKGTTMTRMEFEIMVRAVGLYDAWTGIF